MRPPRLRSPRPQAVALYRIADRRRRRPDAPPSPAAHLPGVAADLLAVADRLTNRELARRIKAVVARLPGIVMINPESGSPFDPAAHSWAETREATEPQQCDRIAEVLDPGFRESHTRKVLKPARVAVYDTEENPHE
ncbi:nucleotide exchange factor GrpE [Streptomyces sp. NPDC090085]|uniref:nucleotide exchange factor GrpE n=1 Tax=Streptomyces sp. NPDC090085 TaxID=3365943 RepID=UPI00382E9DEC